MKTKTCVFVFSYFSSNNNGSGVGRVRHLVKDSTIFRSEKSSRTCHDKKKERIGMFEKKPINLIILLH